MTTEDSAKRRRMEIIMANYDTKKSKRERQKKLEADRRDKQPLLVLAPLIAILAFIPLITYYYKYDTHLEEFSFPAPETMIDFFLYYKRIFIFIACGCMLLILLYLFFIEEQKILCGKNLIPLAVYAVLSLLSACLSENSYFSFHGIYDQFESVWVLLGYCLIVYYSYYVLRTENSIQRTMNWFLVGIILTVLLGLSQVFSHDFFRTEFAKKLITPSNYGDGSLDFKFELGRPYLSVYNPNYVGFYVTLTIPILVALIFTAKRLWQRLIYGVLIAALLLILFASQSRAGIVALIVSFIVMLFCMRKVFIKNWITSIAIIAVACISFLAINVMNQDILLNRLKTMFDVPESFHALKSIETNNDNVTITYNDAQLSFYVMQDAAGNDTFTLVDGNNTPVPCAFDENTSYYNITDERFPFMFGSVRSESFNGFTVKIEGYDWFFTNMMKENDTTYYCMINKLVKLTKHPETTGYFATHERLASGRGYIWAKSLPLLKDYFLLGSGPDTFVIAFPNDDRVSMVNSGFATQLITKPHCLYLQIAVQTGVVSLIAFLIFFGWYVVSSFRIYWKHDFQGYLPKFGVAILTSVIGYLIMGLTNDSCITVAPIFFVLTGMGLGINHSLKIKAEENNYKSKKA